MLPPFAFRVMDEIKQYRAAGEQLGCKWEDTLDEQIVQKILPKCKGADLRIGGMLKTLEGVLPADAYPLSHAKIQRMIEGFHQHGFASYF